MCYTKVGLKNLAQARCVCHGWKRVTEATMRPRLQTESCKRFVGQFPIRRVDRQGELPFRLLLRYHGREFPVASLPLYRCARCGERVASIGCSRHRCVRTRGTVQTRIAMGVLTTVLALILRRRVPA